LYAEKLAGVFFRVEVTASLIMKKSLNPAGGVACSLKCSVLQVGQQIPLKYSATKLHGVIT
jgi:hypothetical protein